MAAPMKGLEKSLQDFGNNAYIIAEKINRHLKSIGDTATKVTSSSPGWVQPLRWCRWRWRLAAVVATAAAATAVG